MTKQKPYPRQICQSCGSRYGKGPQFLVSSWYTGECGICGKTAACTEPRDFGHLKDGWQNHKEQS